MSENYDVVVIGGGPAGCAMGNFLARAGVGVVVLEKGRHPRHRIGESLLAASMPILGELGVTVEEMQRWFQPKFGARFYDPTGDRLATFEFAAPAGGGSPSFQALREELDCLLLKKARAAGCVVEEEAEVIGVEEERERPRVTLADGRVVEGLLLVDATGREPVLAMKRKTRTVYTEYGRVGIYNYFEGLGQHDDLDEKYITMYVFEGGWFWMIPLRDGRTSVGVVYRRMPVAVGSGQWSVASKTEGLFWHAVRGIPRLEERLRGARGTEPYRAIADYSYAVSEVVGPSPARFAAIGDAAGFLDPIFSSGVHLALASAQKASAGIVEMLRTGSEEGLRAYAAYLQQGFHVFRAFVHRFYNRDLVNNLFFMPNKPPVIHAAITNILAGHVWDETNPVLRMLGKGDF